MGELKNAVRPEFLNRIDDIIVFNRLSEDEIAQIADNMLRQVAARMQDMEITMTGRTLPSAIWQRRGL